MREADGADAVIAAATQMLGERLGASRIVFAEIDEAAGVAAIRPGWVTRLHGHLAHHDPLPERFQLNDFGEQWLRIYQAGQTVVVHDCATDPRFTDEERRAWWANGQSTGLGAPVMKNGRLRGVLATNTAMPRFWTESDIAIAEEVAERTWSEVERARAEAALRESEQALAADLAGTSLLRDLSERLVTEEDLATIHEEILSAAIEITRSDAGTVQLYEPETRSLVLLVTHGFDSGMTQRFHRIDADSRTACGRSLRDGQRTFVDFDVDGADEACRMHVEAGYRTAQATPLVSRAGAPLGMLNTHWCASGHRPSERELRFLDLLARQAADLIERGQAQRKLRDSEERLSQFGEASQDVLWIRDAETLQWTYLTPAFETIYGLGREEALTGDNYRNWQDLIVPEDREHAIASIARVRAGESVTFEYRVRRPRDGAVRWLRNTDFPITDGAGKVVLIGGIGTDFTEVREAELRLQTLVEGMPQLVWRAVDGGEWTWANSQWTDYTGQGEVDFAGWGWLHALHPDDRTDARAAWSDARKQGGFTIEYRLRRAADGEYRWFQTRAAPVRDKAGTIVEWLGTSTEINDLREMQERQGVMVAELQHRTRNLITVIRSLSERTSSNATSIDDFRARFNQRLSALSRVQGLLSHLSAGQRVTLDELLRSELGALGALDANDDKVTLDGLAGVRLRSATVQTFALALHELATNAVKYGALATQGGHLTVGWRVVPAADGAEPRLHADWRETGVALTEVGAESRGGGYGRELIERALPYQLKARTTYELTPDGVHCTIDVPISRA